jgi:hypothetical protein
MVSAMDQGQATAAPGGGSSGDPTVAAMPGALSRNEQWLDMLQTLVGAGANLTPARSAFEATVGDFDARFAAAVQALVARQVSREVFIDIPADPRRLSRAELDALVRPVAAGHLRAQPTKGELLEQVELIRQRQARRPGWVPRADRQGRPLPSPVEPSGPRQTLGDGEQQGRATSRVEVPELGEIPVDVPATDDDRPELVPVLGGMGELEVVLHAVLATDRGAQGVVGIDPGSNEALVPGSGRRPRPAAQDPGVAGELLATTATLAGVPVTDGADAEVRAALAGAADWRYRPRWLLDTFDLGGTVAALATARAALAAWADERGSGLVLVVYGGVLRADDGLFGVPGPLHSFVLCARRSADGTDAIGSLHRVVLSCPGQQWCHRGGCTVTHGIDLTHVIAAAEAADAAGRHVGWAAGAYERADPDTAETVLDHAHRLLGSAGWVELERSTWQGGLEDLLVRRGEHCLRASYDPVTRQLKLTDGRTLLEFLVQDGAVEEQPVVELALPNRPQITVLGLHPHADGTLLGPGSPVLVERQLSHLLWAAGVG